MANFKTHITTSTVLGVAYGAGAYTWFDVPLPSCLLATGLCSVSGMLPDLDSGNSVPLRESLAFGAAVVPMLMIERFRNMGMSTEAMVLCGAIIYLLVRFGLGKFLRSYTVHRGMFHSLPAAVIFAELAFLICDCSDLGMRFFKAGAVTTGFLSHLLLDELWSVEWHRGRWRFKRSFGTAFKLWGNSTWGNISVYAKLLLLTYVVMSDSHWMGEMHEPHPSGASHFAEQQMQQDVERLDPRMPSPDEVRPEDGDDPEMVNSWLDYFLR